MARGYAAYARRFSTLDYQIPSAPHPQLGMGVVVPCYDEPRLERSLDALKECEPPSCAVEIIVVVNCPQGVASDVWRRCLGNLEMARRYEVESTRERIRFHAINAMGLPARKAGVGVARKIGMDELTRRFDGVDIGAAGILVCFDADTQCAPTLLTQTERRFRSRSKLVGVSIHFEHPIEGDEEAPAVYSAIQSYELGLRYYVRGVAMSGFPFGIHTIGSSMAVSTKAYWSQGGMNQRQAGEDFYFLHKIAQYGPVEALSLTQTIPSPRPSHRVPFGTGRAVSELIEESKDVYTTYPIEAFVQLSPLKAAIDRACESGVWKGDALAKEPIGEYLDRLETPRRIAVALDSSSDPGTRQKAVLDQLNAFWVMKWLNHARDRVFGSVPVEQASRAALQCASVVDSRAEARSIVDLLKKYREIDRRADPEYRPVDTKSDH